MNIVLCSSVWLFIFVLMSWRLVAIAKKAYSHLHRLHQVPCSGCAYFTGDYRLKCTVNPMSAMSEEAIGCRDFMPQSDSSFSNSRTTVCRGCSQKTKVKCHK